MTQGNGDKPSGPDFVLNQNVSSTNQSGGVTAHTVNFVSAKPPMRRLSDPAAVDLKRRLLGLSPDKTVQLRYLASDAEASQFAEQILSFFEANGYRVDIGGLMMGSPFTGLRLRTGDDTHYLMVGAAD